jgi:hypothetical protein
MPEIGLLPFARVARRILPP